MAKARKPVLLRLDPAVHDAVARWAADELRSANAQIEFLLRRALAQAGRLPADVGGLPKRGRPPKDRTATDPTGSTRADAAPEPEEETP
jgi:hypothetical protein